MAEMASTKTHYNEVVDRTMTSVTGPEGKQEEQQACKEAQRGIRRLFQAGVVFSRQE